MEVSDEILDLLEFSVRQYEKTDGQVNIAMGPVLSIWHDYMKTYSGADPQTAQLPPMEELQAAAQHTDLSKLIIDREAGTVFLTEAGMSLARSILRTPPCRWTWARWPKATPPRSWLTSFMPTG